MANTYPLNDQITFRGFFEKGMVFGKLILENARTILSRLGAVQAIKMLYQRELKKLKTFLGVENNTVSEIEPIPVPVSETVTEIDNGIPIAQPIVAEDSQNPLYIKDSQHKRIRANLVDILAIKKGMTKVDNNPTIEHIGAVEEPTLVQVPEAAEEVHAVEEPILAQVPEASEETPMQVDVTEEVHAVEESALAQVPEVSEETPMQIDVAEEVQEDLQPTVVEASLPEEVVTASVESAVQEHSEINNDISAAGPKSENEVGAVINRLAARVERDVQLEETNIKLTAKVDELQEGLSIANKRLEEKTALEAVKDRKIEIMSGQLSTISKDHELEIESLKHELAKKDDKISVLSEKADMAEEQKRRADEAVNSLNGVVGQLVKLADYKKQETASIEGPESKQIVA